MPYTQSSQLLFMLWQIKKNNDDDEDEDENNDDTTTTSKNSKNTYNDFSLRHQLRKFICFHPCFLLSL